MRWEQLLRVTGQQAGSGYLIAPRLVLSSAHVTGGVGAAVRVFRPGASGVYAARVLWCGTPGGRDDAALVEVTDPQWVPPAMRPVVWGRTVTHQPGIACRSWGVPDFAQHEGGATELAQPTGRINPGAGLVGNRYVVELDAHPPAQLGESPWSGISGAAVYCGDLLTGVVAADPAHRAHGALDVVPAYVLLNSDRFREVVTSHGGEAGSGWAPVELQHLSDRHSPTRTATAPATPASLLLARRAIVKFRPGRETLLDQLLEWAKAPGIGVQLITGAGGHGKTRLAHHFAGQLTDQKWTVLWLDPHAPHTDLAVLAQVVTSLLVIIDYAESRVGQVQELLTTLAATTGDRSMKVLLLARTHGDWWNEIPTGSDDIADLTDTAAITELSALDPDPGARAESYRAAVEAFATALPGLPGPTQAHGWAEAADKVLAAPVPEFVEDTSVLTVQMTALTALLDTSSPPSSARAGARGIEDRVLDHEYRYWGHIAASHGLTSLDTPALKDVVATTAVLAPTGGAELDEILGWVPELAEQPLLIRNRTRAWLTSLYPGQEPGVFTGLAPDRVAERLVGRLMLDRTRPCVIEHLTALPLTDTRARQLLTVCTRAAAHPILGPMPGQRLTAWCRTQPDTMLVHAIEVATHVENPTPLTTALDDAITDPTTPTTVLITLHDSLPDTSQALAEIATAMTEALVRRYRTDGTPPETNPALAGSLNNLANRLGDLGRPEDGLAAIEEATRIRRALAQQRPDTYRPALAGSLHNLANRLGALGRHEDGLAAIEEATRIHRALAQQQPDTYRPALAMSLNNLANRLGDLGRPEDGLAASEEATRIHRTLAQQRPDTYRPALAMSLHNLAVRLGDLGRPEDGLAASEEATRIHRTLAQQRPDTYRPALATSLHNLANRLGALGRHEDGLAAIEEATRIRRALAQQRPDTFLPDLAMSLNNLANRLGVLGRHEDGLAAIEEATRIRRALAQQRPDTYLSALANSLNNLAVQRGDLGRHEDGLAAIEEATRIYRALARQRPDTHLAALATSLNNLAVQLGDLAVQRGDHGRPEDGLAAIEEATRIYRALAQQRPDTYLPDLAMSLNNLAVQLGDHGRHEDGLAAIEEGTRMYRALAQQRPDTYLPDLATSLHNLANRLGDLGRHEDGLAAIEEATRIFQRLNERRPGQYDAAIERGERVRSWLTSLPDS
ncbi:hypothetical protein BOX37_22660 [Nocardia mangyaensis]|uniref:Uncharacterized protein n=1 Tax=Nocardia mangyaensis TaxID=2213200 RepID=A0A1J0VWE5_9NOCA|nr:tetratricopeptide repeat protein [Nocardia mangyaensis]APE36263.1 hypothetical protein BOX37_22660 [Nocardia mangyaensis]